MSEAPPAATRLGVTLAFAAIVLAGAIVAARYDGHIRLHWQPRYPYERQAITLFLGRKDRTGEVMR